MNEFKQQCIKLREKDHTLSEIMQITGRSKTSIYFHIQNIALSSLKQKEIRDASRTRVLDLSQARKGKSKKPFKKFPQWNIQAVSLVAHLLFGGEIQSNKCVYSNRSVALCKKVENSMCLFYDFEPKRRYNKQTGVTSISYFNVELTSYLKHKAKALLIEIEFFPEEFKREFLRAFFDDEGCIDFKPHSGTRRVRGYQKDTTILYLVWKLLRDFNINAKIQLPNEVVISKKENLLKFQKEIGFSIGVKMNGNRPNSVWKKHMEKSDILKKAIDSYGS
ncbi:MAG: LAGLIDADG family homing endonuclease [Candidatus Paceibacterota bacterium]